MQIEKNSVVSITYTLTNAKGEILDTNAGKEPLAFLQGAGNIIQGLENALTGKNAGDSFKVVVNPDEGYGDVNPKLIQKVAKSAFQGVPDVKVGMQFQGKSEHGTTVVRVVDVTGTQVTIDANHPLAGVTLNFDVTVVGVRQATPDEIAHGHVHGADGHHHH